MSEIIVTTGDIKRDYEILGPIYFQVSNKGLLLGGTLERLKRYYSDQIQAMKAKGTMSRATADWGFLYGEWSVGQNDFEAAFFIATEELKKRAKMVGADAVIGMRQDIDMDTTGFCYFYLQMYGTAVKFKEGSRSCSEQYEYAEDLMSSGRFAEAEEIYFQLGDFRDSREKAGTAYEMQLTSTYAKAEEMMAQEFYVEAEKLYNSLRSYKDSREKAETARQKEKEKQEAAKSRAQRVDNRGWTCPQCGKANPFFVRKCTCGFDR